MTKINKNSKQYLNSTPIESFDQISSQKKNSNNVPDTPADKNRSPKIPSAWNQILETPEQPNQTKNKTADDHKYE